MIKQGPCMLWIQCGLCFLKEIPPIFLWKMPHRDHLKLFSKLCCEFSAVCVFSKKCPHIPMKNVIRPMITRLYKGQLGWYRVSIILVCKFKGFTEVYLDLQRVSIICISNSIRRRAIWNLSARGLIVIARAQRGQLNSARGTINII